MSGSNANHDFNHIAQLVRRKDFTKLDKELLTLAEQIDLADPHERERFESQLSQALLAGEDRGGQLRTWISGGARIAGIFIVIVLVAGLAGLVGGQLGGSPASGTTPTPGPASDDVRLDEMERNITTLFSGQATLSQQTQTLTNTQKTQAAEIDVLQQQIDAVDPNGGTAVLPLFFSGLAETAGQPVPGIRLRLCSDLEGGPGTFLYQAYRYRR